MSRIGIYFAPSNHRSELVANAMLKGIQAAGAEAQILPSSRYHGSLEFDVAIFYGLAMGLNMVFRDYRQNRRAIYIDLGYWGRRKRSRWDGYHKLVLNSRHPTAYFQRIRHPSDRFEAHHVQIRPWRTEGQHVLVVGMSAKAAQAENLQPHAWETKTIQRLQQLTDRPIIYRPKPNWPGARPIDGALFQRDVPLEEALQDCHAVVAHHSNVAVDALLAGIPCICPGGAASVLSGHELEQIENPPTPDGREQWAADLAYVQWSIEEMERGDAYRYLVAEGLI
jgi:hypothetical protein